MDTKSFTNGIDVSNWQGKIDWQQVAQWGAAFAFIKASEGETFVDKCAVANFTQSREQGILAGLYHFYRAERDSAKQASNFLQVWNQVVARHDADLHLPPVLDLEDAGNSQKIPNKLFLAGIQQWLDIVRLETRCKPIIYSSPNFIKTHLAKLDARDGALWIAHWNTERPQVPLPFRTWHFWQRSDKGQVSGINGNVDLDLFNGSKSELIEFINGSRVT